MSRSQLPILVNRQLSQVEPTREVLLEASAQFANWVRQQAPGAVVMLCGGLALSQYGNKRVTYVSNMHVLCVDTETLTSWLGCRPLHGP